MICIGSRENEKNREKKMRGQNDLQSANTVILSNCQQKQEDKMSSPLFLSSAFSTANGHLPLLSPRPATCPSPGFASKPTLAPTATFFYRESVHPRFRCCCCSSSSSSSSSSMPLELSTSASDQVSVFTFYFFKFYL